MPRPELLLLLLAVAGSRQLSITELEVPSAAEEGVGAALRCAFAPGAGERVEYVKWWWTPRYVASDDRNRVLLYQRLTGLEPEIPRRNIEWKGNDTIEILNLSPGDSGVYECEVSGDAEVREHANLTVYSNSIDLKLNVTKVEVDPDTDAEEFVSVRCEASDVTPQPELSISVNGIEIENITQQVSGGADGLYDVVADAAVLSVDAEDAEFRCELFYDDKNITHPPYVQTIKYTTGAGLSTTETPEDTTHSEVASESQDPNGVVGLHASLWIMLAAAVVQFYVVC